MDITKINHYDPVSLSKELNNVGYNTIVEGINNFIIYSKPEGLKVIGFVLKKRNIKTKNTVDGFKINALCLRYEIPNISPARYDKDCYVSSSALMNKNLLIKWGGFNIEVRREAEALQL